MVKTTEYLKYELKKYAEPNNKIHLMIISNELIPLTKGVFENNKNANPFTLARWISYPSYISFESALSYYGLIPEGVYAITSASLNKRKNKKYTNFFGTFTYSDIPERVYPLGVILVSIDDNYSFYIASKEKALCDKIYKSYLINNYNELETLLFADLRIDKEVLLTFNLNDMKTYSENYKSTNVNLLYKYLRKLIKWIQLSSKC